MEDQLIIERNEAPAELWPGFLTEHVTFEVESPVDPGGYIKEISFVVRGDKPMADHEIDDHWMG